MPHAARCRAALGTIAVLCALALPFLAAPHQASANLLLNPTFTSTTLTSPGGYICQNTGNGTCISNITSWGSTCDGNTCGTSGTVASLIYNGTNASAFNGNRGLWGTIPNGPDGQNFVAIDGDPNFTATLFQTVNNLTIGQDYTLNFYQAAAQQKGTTGATTEQWEVKFGTQTLYTNIMDNPSEGVTGWEAESLHFTATATSQTLTFFALGTPGGEPPVVLLDGVSLLLPEPASLALAAIGLLALGAARARRQASV